MGRQGYTDCSRSHGGGDAWTRPAEFPTPASIVKVKKVVKEGGKEEAKEEPAAQPETEPEPVEEVKEEPQKETTQNEQTATDNDSTRPQLAVEQKEEKKQKREFLKRFF